MNKNTGKILLSLLAALLFYIVCLWLHGGSVKQEIDASAAVKMIERSLHKTEGEMNSFLDLAVSERNKQDRGDLFTANTEENIKLAGKGMYSLVFEHDSLIFWSSSVVAFPAISPGRLQHGELIKLPNGYYEVFKRKKDARVWIGLLQISSDYTYRNKYVENKFNPALKAPPGFELLSVNTDNALEINNSENKFLFAIRESAAVNEVKSSGNVPAKITFFIFLFFLFLFLFQYGRFASRHTGSLVHKLGYVLGLLGLRFFSFVFEWPAAMYSLDLFDPRFYASSASALLNSLGDLLLNVALGYALISFFYSHVLRGKLSQLHEHKATRKISAVFFVLLFLFSIAFANDLLHGLLINSSISFNVNNIFSLDVYSLTGFGIIALLMFSVFMLADVSVISLLSSETNMKERIITTGLIFLIFFLYSLNAHAGSFFENYDLFVFLWSLALYLTLFFIRRYGRLILSFGDVLLIIILFTLFSGGGIYRYGKEKELNDRILLAQRIDSEQDHIAETLFEDVEKKILEDKQVATLLRNPEQYAEVIAKRIRQLYLSGYWSKYDINLQVCDRFDNPYLSSSPVDTLTYSYADSLIEIDGRETYSNRFYFIASNTGRTRYMAIIEIPDTETGTGITGSLIFDLEAKLVQEDSGFPELLLSSKVRYNRDLAAYSYARYIDGKLINQNGSFPFGLGLEKFKNDKEQGEYYLLYADNFEHLVYRLDADHMVVVSRENDSLFNYLTLFSYLFAWYCITVLIILPFAVPFKFSNNVYSLKNRIQISMIGLVVLSLLLIGGGTAFYITSRYDKQIAQDVGEKVTSVQVAIENELGFKAGSFGDFTEDLVYRLDRLSGFLGTDFNLYSTSGELLFTTQSKLYEEGLISRRIDPNAYAALFYQSRSKFQQYENIGKLQFLAAYEPVRNENNKVLGYLGLPYFSKESDLKDEISNFLVALINIYVLLFILAFIGALFLASRITIPLQVIQSRLSAMRLGKSNEPIRWRYDDEIGGLVREYNRMVEELSESAARLARSEREGAWREMAKQVAHEIKNPLTPMKLSVQHLMRVWKDDRSDKEEVLKKITKTIEEQIDTLSNIATEFSNFAVMPKGNRTKIDVVDIVDGVIGLYGVDDKVNFSFSRPQHKIYILADRDQISRVFSNLIKNSIQAIPEEREGRIEIMIDKQDDRVHISISDNGIGIDTEQGDKIFSPSFTTKTGGMGLGLAMVKSIVEQAGGEISYESELELGTTFNVSLPYIQ